MKPVLDHNHDNGLIRGVLCRNCNQAEGRIRKWLEAIAKPNGLPLVEVVRRLLDYAYTDEVYPLYYPDNKFFATKEELSELSKLKRNLRTLKTKEAKERTNDRLKSLQETIRGRRPDVASVTDIESILSQGRKKVKELS